MGRKQKRQSTKSYATKLEQSQRSNGSSNASGIVPEPEKCLEQIDESSEKAVIESSDAKESNRIFGFACPDCADFELALAENALEFYQQAKQDALGFEVGHVLSAYFKYSTMKVWASSREDVCHISFCAKAKNSSVGDVPKKWFFAEVVESPKGYFVLTRVEILDPYDEGILCGCVFCPHHVLYPHPPGTDSYGDDWESIDAKRFCHYHKCEEEKGEEKKNEKWSIKHEQIYYLECEDTWVKVPS